MQIPNYFFCRWGDGTRETHNCIRSLVKIKEYTSAGDFREPYAIEIVKFSKDSTLSILRFKSGRFSCTHAVILPIKSATLNEPTITKIFENVYKNKIVETLTRLQSTLSKLSVSKVEDVKKGDIEVTQLFIQKEHIECLIEYNRVEPEENVWDRISRFFIRLNSIKGILFIFALIILLTIVVLNNKAIPFNLAKITKASEVIDNLKGQETQDILDKITKASEVIDNLKGQDTQDILVKITKASEVIGNLKGQDTQDILVKITKASEVINNLKGQDTQDILVKITKASEVIGNLKGQDTQDILDKITNASKVIEDLKDQKTQDILDKITNASKVISTNDENDKGLVIRCFMDKILFAFNKSKSQNTVVNREDLTIQDLSSNELQAGVNWVERSAKKLLTSGEKKLALFLIDKFETYKTERRKLNGKVYYVIEYNTLLSDQSLESVINEIKNEYGELELLSQPSATMYNYFMVP
ncbi:MAG: hypothetical protein HQK65_00300 [Desulfamplus sp.]|nr:hypothetical protein [Desulfamplus sp.]